jgi:hypothetical protein
MAAATVRNEACKLMARRDVTAMVMQLKEEAERAVVASALSETDYVRQRLKHFAEHATPADAQKIRATELLGKTQGMFKDVVLGDPDDAKDAKQIRAEMAAVLAKLEHAEATKDERVDPALITAEHVNENDKHLN